LGLVIGGARVGLAGGGCMVFLEFNFARRNGRM
jgi:hypothetical protein